MSVEPQHAQNDLQSPTSPRVPQTGALKNDRSTHMGEKPTVIFIDDEERVVRALSIMCRAYYNVIATTSPNEALDALRKQRVHVLVSDQRMPDVTGVELLRQARAISPSTMRILLTGYSDLAAIVGSINDGEIFRFINKPWGPGRVQEHAGPGRGGRGRRVRACRCECLGRAGGSRQDRRGAGHR
jgi:CheY-like chemotaxis protein